MIPPGAQSVVVRVGPYPAPDGTALDGVWRFLLSRSVYHQPTQTTVIAVVRELLVGGNTTKELPLLATDSAGLLLDDARPLSYLVHGSLRDGQGHRVEVAGRITLPAAAGAVDLDALLAGVPSLPATGEVLSDSSGEPLYDDAGNVLLV